MNKNAESLIMFLEFLLFLLCLKNLLVTNFSVLYKKYIFFIYYIIIVISIINNIKIDCQKIQIHVFVEFLFFSFLNSKLSLSHSFLYELDLTLLWCTAEILWNNLSRKKINVHVSII